MRGIIKIGDETVLEKVIFHISRTEPSSQRMGSWSGFFTVPLGGLKGAMRIYNSNEPTVLVLEDGTTGQFNWAYADDLREGSLIEFKGTGPLRKP